MQEEYTNVITLTDSDGSDVDFEVLDIVPYKEHEYVVMLPVDDESDSPEAVILELLEAEEDNEEDMLQGVDDEEILRVNREFVHHDYYTDHIGFDYSVGDTLSGDVVVGVETVADNARLLGVEYMQELHRVMIHGVLHLCGMEDADPCQRARMQDAEDKALQRLACIGPTSDGAK